jgi:RNA polymerase sigma-70 factor (ECF subfamily)
MTAAPHEDALVERLLVLRAQLGAREAWGRLVERYDARLLFYLRRLLGSAAEAEDLRQEVWLTVVRKLATLEDPGAFRTWLYRVARHHAISWLRKRRAEISLDEADPRGEGVAEVEADESALSVEEAAAVYAALDRLSPSHREMLSLRFLGGLTYEEIAGVVDCPVGTVRSRIHYAKSALRAVLAEGAGREAASSRKKGRQS